MRSVSVPVGSACGGGRQGSRGAWLDCQRVPIPGAAVVRRRSSSSSGQDTGRDSGAGWATATEIAPSRRAPNESAAGLRRR